MTYAKGRKWGGGGEGGNSKGSNSANSKRPRIVGGGDASDAQFEFIVSGEKGGGRGLRG